MRAFPAVCRSTGRGTTSDAGHYRSSRAVLAHLRFNEDNCHAQSKKENRYNSGNAVDYRIGLIARIGLERVEALESDDRAQVDYRGTKGNQGDVQTEVKTTERGLTWSSFYCI
jgi:hypothetical protein